LLNVSISIVTLIIRCIRFLMQMLEGAFGYAYNHAATIILYIMSFNIYIYMYTIIKVTEV